MGCRSAKDTCCEKAGRHKPATSSEAAAPNLITAGCQVVFMTLVTAGDRPAALLLSQLSDRKNMAFRCQQVLQTDYVSCKEGLPTAIGECSLLHTRASKLRSKKENHQICEMKPTSHLLSTEVTSEDTSILAAWNTLSRGTEAPGAEIRRLMNFATVKRVGRIPAPCLPFRDVKLLSNAPKLQTNTGAFTLPQRDVSPAVERAHGRVEVSRHGHYWASLQLGQSHTRC